MRLIDTSTLLLQQYFGDQIPAYAILSHTWGDQEITFQEWQNREEQGAKGGYQKIIDACRQARSDGHQHIWVDTVCIDKSSSAELSEAINSMFNWYRLSQICYAYLVDVKVADYTLTNSRWFKRGWTLQELIAPKHVVFFSVEWKELGTRVSLRSEISTVTGIDEIILVNRDRIRAASVARKMSWISCRSTTRPEDIAYCMLGLFNINMPLLYGEGSKAFLRLQEEIVKTSNDHTLFCWTRDRSVDISWGNVLAPSPACFQHSRDFFEPLLEDKRISPYSMTNFGLSITLPILETWSHYIAILDAKGERNETAVGIPLSGLVGSKLVQRAHFPPCPITIGDSDLLQEWGYGVERQLFLTNSMGSNFQGAFTEHHAHRSILVAFHNRAVFKSYSSVPPGLFDESRSLFTVMASDKGPQTLQQSYSSKAHQGQGVFSYGLLQLTKHNGKKCNILFGVKYYQETSQSVRWRWYKKLLPSRFPNISESSLREFVARYVQREEFSSAAYSGRSAKGGLQIWGILGDQQWETKVLDSGGIGQVLNLAIIKDTI